MKLPEELQCMANVTANARMPQKSTSDRIAKVLK